MQGIFLVALLLKLTSNRQTSQLWKLKMFSEPNRSWFKKPIRCLRQKMFKSIHKVQLFFWYGLRILSNNMQPSSGLVMTWLRSPRLSLTCKVVTRRKISNKLLLKLRSLWDKRKGRRKKHLMRRGKRMILMQKEMKMMTMWVVMMTMRRALQRNQRKRKKRKNKRINREINKKLEWLVISWQTKLCFTIQTEINWSPKKVKMNQRS